MRVLLVVMMTAGFAAGQGKDCTAEGTVVNALTGNPIAHAQVIVARDQGASTDGGGKWRIAGLPCDVKRFTVSHAGFLDVTAEAGLIRMTQEAAVFGKVLDDVGDPIAGAEVRIFNSVVQRGKRVMGGSVSVNANAAGEYRTAPLAAGRYILCARSSKVTYPVGGGGHIAYGESCYPAAPSAGAGNALGIEAGQEIHQDFHVPSVPGVHVRGTVTGVPAGARIEASLVNGPLSIANGPVTGQASQILKGGTFDFAGVLPGAYVVEGLALVDGASRLANAAVDVGASDVEGVALTFVASVTVDAIMRAASGKLPDDLRLNVSLIPSDPGLYVGIPERDSSENKLEWSAIAPGKYRIDATSPPEPWYIQSVSLDGHDVRGEEFIIGPSSGPIEIALGDDGGNLEGSVADANGKPVSAQIMLLRGNLPPLQARSEADGSHQGSLQEGGRFKMSGIPPGDYLAYAFDDSRMVEYAEPDWMRQHAGPGVPVTMAPGGTATVSLVRTVMVRTTMAPR
jgi:hypothetical protein